MPVLVALLLGAALGVTQFQVLTTMLGVDLASRPEIAALVVAGPAVIAIVVALIAGRGRTRSGDESAEPAQPATADQTSALRLLAVLQEEGRLIDFLIEDVAPYSDEQVGAATRGIHERCAKALRAAVRLEPILPGEEDDAVTVEPGFDPSTIRLSGNVSGEPPFSGSLRHAGWRVTDVNLPERAGIDPHVVAPAEVEID